MQPPPRMQAVIVENEGHEMEVNPTITALPKFPPSPIKPLTEDGPPLAPDKYSSLETGAQQAHLKVGTGILCGVAYMGNDTTQVSAMKMSEQHHKSTQME